MTQRLSSHNFPENGSSKSSGWVDGESTFWYILPSARCKGFEAFYQKTWDFLALNMIESQVWHSLHTYTANPR